MQKFLKYIPIINILILIVLFFSGWKKTSEISDFRDYHRASKLFSERKDIYQFEEIKGLQKDFKPEDIFKPGVLEKLKDLQGNIASYIYPPTFAVLLLPISNLEYSTSSKLFYLINFISLLGIIYLLSQMHLNTNFGIILFFTLIGSFRFLENHGSNNQVAFLLMYFSLLSIHLKSDRWSGFLLALAIIIKLTPAILFLYFLYQKRFKVISYTFLFLGGLALLPCLFDFEYGIQQWKNWNEMVLMSAMKSPLFRAWKNNQSLIATLSKYFLTGADPINQSILRMPYVVLEPWVVKQIFLFLTAGLFVPLLLKIKKGIGGFQLFSALMTLSCILSGISWVHSFSVMLFPIFYLIIKAREFPEKIKLKRASIISIGLIIVTSKSIIGSSIESILLMFSILLYISISIYLIVLSYNEEEFLI